MKMDTRLRGYDMYSDAEICKDSEYKDKFKTAKHLAFHPHFTVPQPCRSVLHLSAGLV